MKVPSKHTYEKLLTKRLQQAKVDFENIWDTMPQGQRVFRLGYSVFTFDGLKDLFNFNNVQDQLVSNVEQKLISRFCAENNITVSQFKENYDVENDLNTNSEVGKIGVFKISLDSDVEEAVDKIKQSIKEKYDQAARSAEEQGHPVTAIRLDHSEFSLNNEPLMEHDVVKLMVTLEPIQVYCRDLIPDYVIRQIDFARTNIGLQDFMVAFVSVRNGLALYSPRTVMASLGRHYLVEIASWR